MYVTRPLSMYKRFPELLSAPTAEGPNSGYLVVLDEDAETTCCFGGCPDDSITNLPFPQNKNLLITYSDDFNKVFLIPVLNQPLSSNRYYVIERSGKYKGEAYANSKEEDMNPDLCFGYADVKPKPLDPSDIYQQVEIFRKQSGFSAKSIAPDGIPPNFLRAKGWHVSSSIPFDYRLDDEAPGLNSSLRASLPEFNFPSSYSTSETVVVGKWYCPFMFVKEEMKLKDQVKTSVFYEITLEQRWDKIFSSDSNNIGGEGENVFVDAVVQKEVVFVAGREAVWDEGNGADGVFWYKSFDSRGGEVRVGLSKEIVERIKWEEERVGWEGGDDARQVRVERVEEFGRNGGWMKFGCYVLVERFVLKRMNGRLVLTYDFKHTHQIRSKWE